MDDKGIVKQKELDDILQSPSRQSILADRFIRECLVFEELIARLAQIYRQDDRLLAAMHYGSYTRGEADQYSDLDIMLFFVDEAAPGAPMANRMQTDHIVWPSAR